MKIADVLSFDVIARTLLAWWVIVPNPISCARTMQIRWHPTTYLYERRKLIMTSEERREARYRRRKRKRQMKRWMRSQAVGTLEEVFNYRDMFYWGKKCCNGVRLSIIHI